MRNNNHLGTSPCWMYVPRSCVGFAPVAIASSSGVTVTANG